MAARSSVSARPGGHGLSGVEASAAAHQLAALPNSRRACDRRDRPQREDQNGLNPLAAEKLAAK